MTVSLWSDTKTEKKASYLLTKRIMMLGKTERLRVILLISAVLKEMKSDFFFNISQWLIFQPARVSFVCF